MKRALYIIASLALLALACLTLPLVARADDYDQLFPTYIELCGATEIRLTVGDHGGQGGHYAAYFNGLCPAEADFPQVKVCDWVKTGQAPANSEDAGVGISLDGNYKNVKWTWAKGKNFFLRGVTPDFSQALAADGTVDDKQHATLEEQALDLSVGEAIRQGMFKGVEQKDAIVTSERWTTPEQVKARHFLGTDYAIGLARSLSCQRIPVTAEMLADMAAEYNKFNEGVYSGKVAYNWTFFADNCVHLIHNGVAAAGIWNPFRTTSKPTNPLSAPGIVQISKVLARDFLQLFDVAIPANEMLMNVHFANDREINDPLLLFRNQYDREMIEKRGWLSVQAGSALELVQANSEMKHVYNPISEFFLVDEGRLADFIVNGISKGKISDSKLPQRKQKNFEKVLKQSRYTDLGENLKFMKKKYEDAIWWIDNRRSLDRYVQDGTVDQNPGFFEFYLAYEKTIRDGLTRIDESLQRVAH